MMLGFFLARGNSSHGIGKHKDFFRDFRGDTIHPSTIELLYELGLHEAFLAIPHQEMPQLSISFGGRSFPLADFLACNPRPFHRHECPP